MMVLYGEDANIIFAEAIKDKTGPVLFQKRENVLRITNA